jgi:hypothetical protein
MIASFVALGVTPASAEPADTGAIRALAIVVPSEEQTIFDGRVVEVSLSPVPPLADGERIVVRMDDQIVVLPSGLTKFAITDVPLGTHVLEAIIVDGDANPVAATDTLTFRIGGGMRI